MTRFSVTIAVVLAVFGTATAAWAGDAGGQPGAMLAWSVGARPVAMGGAYVAVAEGPSAFWWNPAGVSQGRQRGFEAALRTMSFDRQAGYLSVVLPFSKEEAAMCLSWVYAGVGDVYSYDIDGYAGEKISDYSNAVALAFARRFSDKRSPLALSIGVNLRYLQHNIAGIDAYSIGFDLGSQVRYQLPRSSMADTLPPEIRFGLSVSRVNQKYPWSTGEYWIGQGESNGTDIDERFPILLRIGTAGIGWQRRVLVAFDLEVDEAEGAAWHLGVEGRPLPLIALRAGLNDGDIALGAGFEPTLSPRLRLVLDYAYAAQPDVIDAEHIFSIGLRF
jgi:hypothetical protein